MFHRKPKPSPSSAQSAPPASPKKKKKKKTKGRWTGVLLMVVFLVGLGVLLYPTVSDWWNSRVQSRAISDYSQAVSDLSKEDFDAIFVAAEDYNDRLRTTPLAFYEPEKVSGYQEALNINGTGVMGYIDIPAIDVHIPIYHTTNESVLQIAVGHLEGSSLPIGGAGTHAVLSAHRGLPSARLFTDLDKLKVGDTFTITVLNRVLTYQIDQIKIVLPTETEDLLIANGQDYCTLMTCTPYGINSHRMLLRGKRIETVEDAPIIVVRSEAEKIDPMTVIPLAAMPILFVLLLYLLIKYRKKKK